MLSIIDSSCHVLGEVKSSTSLVFGKKSDSTEVAEKLTHYKEKISVRISSIGISLINSYPQVILWICSKEAAAFRMFDIQLMRMASNNCSNY